MPDEILRMSRVAGCSSVVQGAPVIGVFAIVALLAVFVVFGSSWAIAWAMRLSVQPPRRRLGAFGE